MAEPRRKRFVPQTAPSFIVEERAPLRITRVVAPGLGVMRPE